MLLTILCTIYSRILCLAPPVMAPPSFLVLRVLSLQPLSANKQPSPQNALSVWWMLGCPSVVGLKDAIYCLLSLV